MMGTPLQADGNLTLALSEGGSAESLRLCWFARSGAKGVTEKNVGTDVASGIIVGPTVEAFMALLTEIYLPSIAVANTADQGKSVVSDFLEVRMLPASEGSFHLMTPFPAQRFSCF